MCTQCNRGLSNKSTERFSEIECCDPVVQEVALKPRVKTRIAFLIKNGETRIHQKKLSRDDEV
jgi:hypothetical protein